MVSKYDMKKYIEENKDKHGLSYNEQEDSVYNKDGYLCTLDELLERYRLNSGQAFTCVYHCPGSLMTILRCDKCGTVIFSSDHYLEYDEHLKCPTCVGYKTNFEYWTKEEIEADEEKQNTIAMYEQFTREDNERYEREKRRGKTDQEITKHKIKTKKHLFQFILGCDNISKSYFKGLKYEIIVSKKDEEDFFVRQKHITIPLSWSCFYIHYLYRHLGKCHPDLRSKWYIGKAVERM
jgi:uncharacterized Zn finger protein (UPF0148 family)